MLQRWMRDQLASIRKAPPWLSSRPLPDNLGEEAARLLDNPVLIEALARVQLKLTETWRLSAPEEQAVRDEAYRLHMAMDLFRQELRLMISGVKL